MGIRERQERDREAIRRAILDAARELFVREGYADVTIRRIAERIEYSPGAIYTYFPSKDEIFFALAKEGFDLLLRHRVWERLDRLEPLTALRAVFRRFYEFSKEQPQYFALMFFERSVPRMSDAYEHFGSLVEQKRRFIASLERCFHVGIFPNDLHPLAAFRVLSMGIFGAAALRLAGRIPSADADALAGDSLEVAIAGLRSGAALRYRPSIPVRLPIARARRVASRR